MQTLKNKIILITGASSGIGEACSKQFAALGARLIITARRTERIKKLAVVLEKKHQVEVLPIQLDVQDKEQVAKAICELPTNWQTINILVNNAGIFPSIPISQMTSENFDHVIATNLKSVFLCTKKVSEKMIAQGKGGKIINITSIDALHPSTIGLAHYDASKHGVWGFTKNSALELAQHKIWVNAIAPGGIATPGVAELQKDTPVPNGVDMSKMLEAFLAKIPAKRMGEPDDIAKVALFLASEMSSYMTGSQIVVDGGVLLS